MKDIQQQFKNPGASFRGKPFWSWNGALEKDELLRQVDIMKEMGFGGFFMHSRTGLETEYLGEEWFEYINACAQKAQISGMEAWLYDEDRWPSGTAGGLVTREPKYRMKYLIMDMINGAEFKWSREYAAVFVSDAEGINYTYANKIEKDTPRESYADKTIIAFYVEEMPSDSFYNGYTYLDTINKEAVEAFIESTHEKYKSRCGDKIGKSIKGIFTDEPHRGGLFTQFGGGVNAVPWTYDLFKKFKERFGYELPDVLPELFLIKNGEKISPVKWQFTELLQQLFIECFAAPINEWCERNNLILTGHVLHEDNFTCQTTMHGSLMRFYEYMGYPGVDVLSEGNKNYWIVKQLSSSARQTGKNHLLSELYGCTGWQFDFDGHKKVGDWQALFGINLRCHHLSWYTMKGEAKRDYPASILHQSGWWEEYKYVEDYFSRIHVMMSAGKPECELLVINPIESVWSRVHVGCFDGLRAIDEDIIRLETLYAELFHWLSGARIDFDYGDEEMFYRLGNVVKTEYGAILKVGEAEYKKVLISGMDTIRLTTLRLLEAFIEAGGEVICAGALPNYVDASKSAEPQRVLANRAKFVDRNSENITQACASGKEVSVLVNGQNVADIFAQSRADGENRIVMLLNVNREQAEPNAEVDLGYGQSAEEWDARSGEVHAVDFEIRDGKIVVNTDFSAGGERIFVVYGKSACMRADEPNKMISEEIVLSGPFEYELNEPNICVLDYAAYSIDGAEWQNPREILKIDQEIRDIFGVPRRGGSMVQPWFAKKHANQELPDLCALKLKFEFEIEDMPQNALTLVMESPNEFKAEINGNTLDLTEPTGNWLDICFKKFNIPLQMLKLGKNEITLETSFRENVDLETVYLLGDFGVELYGNQKTLTKLPKLLKVGDITAQGLPFYSGRVLYKIENSNITGKNVSLKLNEAEAACVKAVSGTDSLTMAFKPYSADISSLVTKNGNFAIEAILTRRNTFGPLHQIPKKANFYDPDSFLTQGDSFMENYSLLPQGLLTPPIFLQFS